MDPLQEHLPNDNHAHDETTENPKKQQNNDDHKTQGAFHFITTFV